MKAHRDSERGSLAKQLAYAALRSVSDLHLRNAPAQREVYAYAFLIGFVYMLLARFVSHTPEPYLSYSVVAFTIIAAVTLTLEHAAEAVLSVFMGRYSTGRWLRVMARGFGVKGSTSFSA